MPQGQIGRWTHVNNWRTRVISVEAIDDCLEEIMGTGIVDIHGGTIHFPEHKIGRWETAQGFITYMGRTVGITYNENILNEQERKRLREILEKY